MENLFAQTFNMIQQMTIVETIMIVTEIKFATKIAHIGMIEQT